MSPSLRDCCCKINTFRRALYGNGDYLGVSKQTEMMIFTKGLNEKIKEPDNKTAHN